MSQAFGLPGTGHVRKSTKHHIDGVDIVVKNNSYRGAFNGYDVWVSDYQQKIFINCLGRDEAAQRALDKIRRLLKAAKTSRATIAYWKIRK